MVDAMNSALVELFTGVEPQLGRDGRWVWEFPAGEGAQQTVFEDRPPAWVQGDLSRLVMMLHAVCLRDGVSYSLLGRRADAAGQAEIEGVDPMRFQVTIGKNEAAGMVPLVRVEAAPVGLAVASAILAYHRIDVDRIRARLYPKIATATVSH